MYAYVCTCICTCMHACLCICMQLHVFVYTCMYVHVQSCSELLTPPVLSESFLPISHSLLAISEILVRLDFMHASIIKYTSISKSAEEFEYR